MNTKDIKDIRDVKTVIGGLEEKLITSAADVKIIKHCLLGNPANNDDLGLVGDVRNNKRWRNNVNKWLGSLGLGFLGLFIKQIFEVFKRA